jgi:hypothetical protein
VPPRVIVQAKPTGKDGSFNISATLKPGYCQDSFIQRTHCQPLAEM